MGSIEVGEHDLRALGREQLRCRYALAAAPSGDDCDLACETLSHDGSLPSVAERSRSVLCDCLCGADDETCEPLIVRSSRSTGPAAGPLCRIPQLSHRSAYVVVLASASWP